MPCNTPGVSLWSRKPFEPTVASEFEGPLTFRFDEPDAMVMFDDVKVPWERVFVHDDPALSRALYIETAAHSYGNHHSNVRLLVKLQLLLGLASRIALANGAHEVPAVRDVLGRLAALEALLAGLVAGQIQAAEEWPTPGYVTFNRRMMYAALNWGVENYSAVVDCPARALRRRGPADAGRHLGAAGRQARRAVPDVLADPAHGCAVAHEAVQARLGHHRLGIRRTPCAI